MDHRLEILLRHGASAEAASELSDRNRCRIPAAAHELPVLPLAEEAHLEAWDAYAREAESSGPWLVLQRRFPQLQFPIREGMSADPDYLRGTRRGEMPIDEGRPGGLSLEEPSLLELRLHPSMAGRVPVLIPATRGDFEMLVQAFTARNEPRSVPSSMGACLVSGLNNWDRVRAYRARWESENGEAASELAWKEEFRHLAVVPALYQDRLLLLSRGPYSGVPASSLGMPEAQWLRDSSTIRLHHEATHFLTLRLFGLLQHNVLEELLADCGALLEVYGFYRVDLALRFLGLEEPDRYRPGGRLENYCAGLSAEAFRVQQELARAAVDNVRRVLEADPTRVATALERARFLGMAACRSLEEWADPSILTSFRT